MAMPWSTAVAAQASQEGCPGAGSAPTPTAVEVGAVPIVVESTTEQYFVLFVQPDLDSDREIPVSVTLGQAGTTTLTEQLSALPKEHYRVERFLTADPADIDGDCIDDITELQDPVGMNPLNAAPAIRFIDGVVAIPDRETFEALSYKGGSVSIDTHLAGLEFVKFVLVGMETDHPLVYFQNTETHRAHFLFEWAIDSWIEPLRQWSQGTMRGEIIFHPNVVAPDGSLGVYRFAFGPLHAYSFEAVAHSYELLAASMPLLNNNLAYYPMPARALPLYHEERALYDDSRLNVLFEDDILPDVDFISLNRGQGYGFLRVMSLEELPNPHDIVIYETLPNELSRVAGIITTVPQTPLSHVNLRAAQDGAPNAFIRDALDDDDIDDLIGSYVHYTVDESGYTIRAATPEEVDAHYAASRPSQTQAPERDLTVTQVTALSDIGFDDWTAFGVKAANVAVLRTLDFPVGTVPDGFAVPFYFYDEFMKHHDLYADIEDMLADPEFQSNFDTQQSELKKLRKKIKKADTPEWIETALTEMHATFPDGASLRYRSSTNNEDLPGFSGAGLYDSKTQHPEETEEDDIAKSLKQVYASLWNFRAFAEREFHRIDHRATVMGVLVHPNFSDELANGVAVSFDPIRGTDGSYYVNTQIGEDLVTNPEAYSVPEEILLHQSGSYDILSTSNQVPQGQLLMSDTQMDQLRRYLEVIHDGFALLYGIETDEQFAIEIEFKITSDNILSIKQARPWVFSDDEPFDISPASPATGAPTINGTAQVGETLTADTSEIADTDGLDNATFNYQWIRNDGNADADIQEATDSSYPLTPDDEGKTVKVRVSFDDDAGNPETVTSAPTAAVAQRSDGAEPDDPAWSADMSVVDLGNGSIGAVRSDLFSNEGGSANLQVKWLWYYTPGRYIRLAFTEVVPGAEELTLQIGDVALTLQPGDSNFNWSDVDVDWEDGQIIPVRIVRTSATMGTQPNNSATGAPAIGGTAQVGETLTADSSGVEDADGLDSVSYRYQWIAGGSDIDGATGSSYTVTNSERGQTIQVRVTFTDDAGNVETVTSVATVAVAAAPQSTASATQASQDACPGAGSAPTPTAVEVGAVPIVVESTTDEYFVLYLRHERESGRTVEVPVSVTLGESGTTTLAENIPALPKERYRVEKYLVADPADVDGDCIDDVTEWENLGEMNPINGAPSVDRINGVVAIPDQDLFTELAFEINDGSSYVKFILLGISTDRPRLYFIDTNPVQLHQEFAQAVGLESVFERAISGEVTYRANLTAPDGHRGVYTYNLQQGNVLQIHENGRFSHRSVEDRLLVHSVLAASMSVVEENLALYVPNTTLRPFQSQLPALRASRVPLVFDEDVLPEVSSLGLNPGEGYGRLRVMESDDRPHPRDVVIYEALPNDLPRVAGIISTVPQTPLSHVNLRAIQNDVPNAFIQGALDDDTINDLIGNYVHYIVSESGGYSIRAASLSEVNEHYASSRPSQTQTPERDLSIRSITSLHDVEFEDWRAFGVKAANVAALRTMGFPHRAVPDGFAVPFYFYDEFMRHNGFYEDIDSMLADASFQTDFNVQEDELKALRKKIKKGKTPEWITEALTSMHSTFPAGTSLRYRSSTNNEDLPEFNGAGLYDSKTQHPDETVEDGISKSLKQVYASLWNFRAFTERDFYRIDHKSAAMGVLVHPNFSGELANGVAVSFDPTRGIYGGYYVNTQVGEDLVTNPEALSVPEELLVREGYREGYYVVLAVSNQAPPGQLIMSDIQIGQLRRRLEVIHERFSELYCISSGEQFAMEIEFKITSDNILSIKQARPWVFSANAGSEPTPATGNTPVSNTPAQCAPVIMGTARVGQLLAVSTSSIRDADGMSSVSFEYQWVSDDTDIAGATGSSYVLGDDDEGKAVKVRVSFDDDAGNPETVVSAPTAAVSALTNSPATGAPTISGPPRVGATLSAATSSIRDADGMSSVSFEYQWVSDDTDIAGATGSSYVLGDDDEGKAVKVRVSFDDDAGNPETVTSAPTAAVAQRSDGAEPDDPAWSADMSVVDLGNGSIGAVRSDLFSNEGGSANLQVKWLWYYTPGRYIRLAFTEVVPGAEELTLQIGDVALTLQPGDSNFNWSDVDVDWEDGQIIPVRIVRTSATMGTQPNNSATGAPAIGGTAQVGETLTADTSPIADADGLDSVSYSYQWVRNDGIADTHIEDARYITYTLDADDVGKTIRVRVSFTDDADNEETLTSEPTEVVQQRINAWSATMTVETRGGFTGYSYWGRPHLGSLSESEVEWDGKTHYVRYVFLNDGELRLGLNEGMFSTGFVLSVGDEEFGSAEAVVDRGGASYRFRWDDPGLGWSEGNEVAVSLVQSDQNTPALGAPTIGGTAQVGETLTADTSGVEDADGLDNVSYSYQWIAGGVDIDGANASAYTLTSSEQDQTIQVRVSFTDDAGNNETLTSAAANRAATGAPTISGTAQVGETLTADASRIADADGLDNVSYSYRWIRDDGSNVTDIRDARYITYTVGADDVGKTIRVRVSFTDDADNNETLTSAATAVVAVAASPAATGAPAIGGTAQVGEKLKPDVSGIVGADLTVSLTVAAPAPHDGSSEFTFEIEFSEEFGISYVTLKTHAFNVTGGEVRKAQRTDKPSNITWRITVRPTSTGDVMIELPPTTDCGATGAICTGDGRKLSNSLNFTVSGPGQ